MDQSMKQQAERSYEESAKTPRPISPYDEATAHACEELARLVNAIDNLFTRLDPVCRPLGPHAAIAPAADDSPGPHARHTEFLHEHALRLSTETSRLQALLDLVDV